MHRLTSPVVASAAGAQVSAGKEYQSISQSVY